MDAVGPPNAVLCLHLRRELFFSLRNTRQSTKIVCQEDRQKNNKKHPALIFRDPDLS